MSGFCLSAEAMLRGSELAREIVAETRHGMENPEGGSVRLGRALVEMAVDPSLVIATVASLSRLAVTFLRWAESAPEAPALLRQVAAQWERPG
jgi:hypothetical protein